MYGVQRLRDFLIFLGALQNPLHHRRCDNELSELPRAEILQKLPCIADKETVAARKFSHNRNHAADVEKRQNNQIFIVLQSPALSLRAKPAEHFCRISAEISVGQLYNLRTTARTRGKQHEDGIVLFSSIQILERLAL